MEAPDRAREGERHDTEGGQERRLREDQGEIREKIQPGVLDVERGLHTHRGHTHTEVTHDFDFCLTPVRGETGARPVALSRVMLPTQRWPGEKI